MKNLCWTQPRDIALVAEIRSMTKTGAHPDLKLLVKRLSARQEFEGVRVQAYKVQRRVVALRKVGVQIPRFSSRPGRYQPNRQLLNSLMQGGEK